MTIHLDFSDRLFKNDPWPIYQWHMANSPAVWAPGMQCHTIFGYTNVRTALTSPNFIAFNPFRRTRLAIGPSMLDNDGRSHDRYRRAVAPYFKPATIADYQYSIVEPIVVQALSELIEQGDPHWLTKLSERVPVEVAATIIGLPIEEAQYIHRIMRPLVDFIDHGSATFETVTQRRDMLREYLQDMSDDVVGFHGFIESLCSTGALAKNEAINSALLLLVAATETTSAAFVNFTTRIAAEPDIFQHWTASPHKITLAVAETLRHEPPLHMTVRYARSDIKLAGTEMPRGTAVQVCLASANRDPSVFPDPDVWQMARRPGQAMTFGAGVHHCLGSSLARMELTVFAYELLRRFASLQLESPGHPTTQGRTFRRVPDAVIAYSLRQ
ncbi:cytochrome P450 [Nocardia brasiliensis]|uniref:cytochrome P450 n=1 Tax=Nocardia brasiliensis TaxID=37326 RepID=UPI0024569B19|nr:cytochrome P450 [Nocardia brasiliensis]